MTCGDHIKPTPRRVESSRVMFEPISRKLRSWRYLIYYTKRNHQNFLVRNNLKSSLYISDHKLKLSRQIKTSILRRIKRGWHLAQAYLRLRPRETIDLNNTHRQKGTYWPGIFALGWYSQLLDYFFEITQPHSFGKSSCKLQTTDQLKIVTVYYQAQSRLYSTNNGISFTQYTSRLLNV